MIEELIALAKEMRAASERGEELGLTEDELAFYDALETNDSAVKVLGDDTLRTIARELVETVRAQRDDRLDRYARTSARKLRVLVKRILRKYGYPPDKQEKATQTVLEQAEVLSCGIGAPSLRRSNGRLPLAGLTTRPIRPIWPSRQLMTRRCSPPGCPDTRSSSMPASSASDRTLKSPRWRSSAGGSTRPIRPTTLRSSRA